MATIQWVDNKKRKILLTKSDGTEIELSKEHDNDNSTIIPGDYISIPNDSAPNEIHIGKVVGFRFNTIDREPEGIFYLRWNGTYWRGVSALGAYEVTPDNFDLVNKLTFPLQDPEILKQNQQGGRNNKSRKNRRTRRR
jgi:hypothetical protein